MLLANSNPEQSTASVCPRTKSSWGGKRAGAGRKPQSVIRRGHLLYRAVTEAKHPLPENCYPGQHVIGFVSSSEPKVRFDSTQQFSRCLQCGSPFTSIVNGKEKPSLSPFPFCGETKHTDGPCKPLWIAAHPNVEVPTTPHVERRYAQNSTHVRAKSNDSPIKKDAFGDRWFEGRFIPKRPRKKAVRR